MQKQKKKKGIKNEYEGPLLNYYSHDIIERKYSYTHSLSLSLSLSLALWLSLINVHVILFVAIVVVVVVAAEFIAQVEYVYVCSWKG